jgi:hypothetical protein
MLISCVRCWSCAYEAGGLRHRHQLDCPIGRRTVIMFTVTGAEIDRCRRTFAFLAAQARQQFPKTHIAALLDQQAHRQNCCAPAAVQLQLALRPVGQTMLEAEGRRVHGGRLQREQKQNKGFAASTPISLR